MKADLRTLQAIVALNLQRLVEDPPRSDFEQDPVTAACELVGLKSNREDIILGAAFGAGFELAFELATIVISNPLAPDGDAIAHAVATARQDLRARE